MSNILYLTASIRSDAESISRGLGQSIVDGLAAKTGASVTIRDIAAGTLPFVNAERFAANLTPVAERTPEQAELAAIADTLIAELQAADTIVIASPVYNFGPPASLKAWADLVARAGTTFRYTATGPEGLLTRKKAYLTIASGGTPMGSDIDFMRFHEEVNSGQRSGRLFSPKNYSGDRHDHCSPSFRNAVRCSR